ncbi:MAG TPA: GspH/FimT family protein [Acidobacteriota bacterium]|nr:GspH/FimT family protein [Acidobacteriota bacterium]
MNNSGFQLLEAMVVCLLLGGAVITSAGPLLRINEQYRLYTAGLSLVSTLSEARTLAVTTSAPLEVCIDEQRQQFGLTSRGEQVKTWMALPNGVRFVHTPRSRVIFYSRGVAVPSGSYLLENSAGGMKVVVSAAGRIRWEYTAGGSGL